LSFKFKCHSHYCSFWSSSGACKKYYEDIEYAVEEVLAFEVQILKDRLTHLHRNDHYY
jgi:hypothetical protein